MDYNEGSEYVATGEENLDDEKPGIFTLIFMYIFRLLFVVVLFALLFAGTFFGSFLGSLFVFDGF